LALYSYVTEPPECVERRQIFLMDGTHRAVLARREGRPFKAFVLTEPEQFECIVSVQSDGREVGRRGMRMSGGIVGTAVKWFLILRSNLRRI
jgi:hypothetical protein